MSGAYAFDFGALIALLTAQLAPVVQDKTPPLSTSSAQAPVEAAPDPLARWLEAQTLTLSMRYDYIADGSDETLQNRMQWQLQIRGRFKFDEAGRYSVHA